MNVEANLPVKYDDIKILTSQSPQDRQNFVRQHARSISGTSQKAGSISSDGIMDEEDEEPFSATNSAVVAPKQDEPKRPQPGGRFPSQLSIDTLSQRGLQAPLSPSSGSSGFGDVQDRLVVAAASSLPGSGVGNHYGADPSSPTHAALVNQQAREDGINPYTSQPINYVQNHSSNIQAADGLAAAGVGAAAGVAGTEAYHHREDENGAENYRQHQEQQAALESSTIAAPDTYEQESEQQAAQEAATLASPDGPLTSVAPDSNFMSGGRSQGDVSIISPQLTEDARLEQSSNRPTPPGNPIETVLKPLTEDARPSLAAGQNHQSVQSISQLHVPGEFPKTNTESGDAQSVLA
jgi:hypothetical protein